MTGTPQDESKNMPEIAAGEPTHGNLAQILATIDKPWETLIMGRANGACVKLMKMTGEYPWHHHIYEDELFYCVAGAFTMEIEGKPNAEVEAGDLVIVPRGVNHRPVIPTEAHVLLVEGHTNSKVFVDPPADS